MLKAFVLCVTVALQQKASFGLQVELSVSSESRRIFFLEEYGILSGGSISVEVEGFKFLADDESQVRRAGFAFLRSDTENHLLDSLHEEVKEEYSTERSCPLDDPSVVFKLEFSSDQVSDKSKGSSKIFKKVIGDSEEGLYEITFVQCGPDGSTSFNFRSSMINPDGNYLSAGDIPIPTVLFAFSFVFAVMLYAWVRLVKSRREVAHKVHHLLTVFMLLKVLAVLSEALDFHYVGANGYSLTWNLLFHFIRSLRAVMFFMVVLLIGTGWSMLKPALNGSERKFLLCVLPLQLVANIALVVADELPKGSSSFMRWHEVFLFIDIVCCGLVTVPIYAHIRQLDNRAPRDKKAASMLIKLKQFRRFYMLVLFYIYFSRIITLLLGHALPFKYTYLQVVARELGAVVFYSIIGYSFRPGLQSGYLELSSSEPISLDDDPIEDQNDVFYEHTTDFGLDENDDDETLDIEMSKA